MKTYDHFDDKIKYFNTAINRTYRYFCISGKEFMKEHEQLIKELK